MFNMIKAFIEQNYASAQWEKFLAQYLIEKSLLYLDVNIRFCQMINNLQVHIKPFEDIGNVSNLFNTNRIIS